MLNGAIAIQNMRSERRTLAIRPQLRNDASPRQICRDEVQNAPANQPDRQAAGQGAEFNLILAGTPNGRA
jgi:hypothetical protein